MIKIFRFMASFACLLSLLISAFIPYSDAQAQYAANIGLYVDDNHSSSCITGEGQYAFEMWIWCLPSMRGQRGAEFAITYPLNVIPSTVTKNTEIVSQNMGSLDWGYTVAYFHCQWDWHWIAHRTIIVTYQTPTWIEIVKHPTSPDSCVVFANCDLGFPTECAIVHTKLGVHAQCPPDNPIAVEKTSWGAIKGLFR